MDKCITKNLNTEFDSMLPVLGRVIFSVPKGSTECYLLARGGVGGSKIDLINTETQGHATELNLNENEVATALLNTTQDDAWVIADAYNIESIAVTKADKVIGFNSLMYGDKKRLDINSFIFGDAIKVLLNTEVRNNIKYLSFPGDLNISQDIVNTVFNNNADSIVVFIATFANTSIISESKLERVAWVNGGLLENLPSTIKRAGMSSALTGSINNLVQKFRNNGRTSGKIQLDYISACSNVTIDDGHGEMSCRQYCDSKHITDSANQYLAWTASTLEITDVPDGAEQYMVFP